MGFSALRTCSSALSTTTISTSLFMGLLHWQTATVSWPCPIATTSTASASAPAPTATCHWYLLYHKSYSCSCYHPSSSSRPSSLTACRISICLRCLSPRRCSCRKIPQTSQNPISWTPVVLMPFSPSRLCPLRTGTTSCLIPEGWLLTIRPVTLCSRKAFIRSLVRTLCAR